MDPSGLSQIQSISGACNADHNLLIDVARIFLHIYVLLDVNIPSGKLNMPSKTTPSAQDLAA